MTAAERSARTEAAEGLLRRWYGDGPRTGAALVALGSHGRREPAPHSDLDVLLLHDSAPPVAHGSRAAGAREQVEVGPLADRLWYPLWDAGVRLDHAVRSLEQCLDEAGEDLRVMLGLLDARHVAGDPALTLRLRSTLLARWRRDARLLLPRLHDLVERRHRHAGEVAHASIPDLKESCGGLRDATVLRALVATWLVDVPHQPLGQAVTALLDVRDVLQESTGRPGNRIAPESWQPLADGLGLADERAAQRYVRRHGRRLAHLSSLTWRRAEQASARTGDRTARDRPGRPGPRPAPLVPGLGELHGEVVVTERHPGPQALLRAAAEASQRGLMLSPATVARLLRDTTPMPEPWPDAARRDLVRLLAGDALLPVWETLEETGALERLLPEWERVHLLPHVSPRHRFTVDRHLVETCREAARLARTVARPDLLLVAALLHDIGKAEPGRAHEHGAAGAPVARAVARRVGFDSRDAETVALLVRHHLLLSETALTRDPADPATAALIAGTVRDGETLALLAALTEADARATAEQAWTPWRAGLVADLVATVAVRLDHRESLDHGTRRPPIAAICELPVDVATAADPVCVLLEPSDGAPRLRVIAPDRIGVLADIARTLARARISVRSARAHSLDDHVDRSWSVSLWEVDDAATLEPSLLRQRFLAEFAAPADPGSDGTARHRRVDATVDPEAVVAVRPDASRSATVLEVRTRDAPGVLAVILGALADRRLSVRSAHVDTRGPLAVDALYVQEWRAGRLVDARAAEAAQAVRDALAAQPATPHREP